MKLPAPLTRIAASIKNYVGDPLGQMTLQSTQPNTLDDGTQVASDPVSSQIAESFF
jgi:hypothetical protein